MDGRRVALRASRLPSFQRHRDLLPSVFPTRCREVQWCRLSLSNSEATTHEPVADAFRPEIRALIGSSSRKTM